MQVLYERCAGIDVHQSSFVVTVLLTQADGKMTKTTRTFATMTAQLRKRFPPPQRLRQRQRRVRSPVMPASKIRA